MNLLISLLVLVAVGGAVIGVVVLIEQRKSREARRASKTEADLLEEQCLRIDRQGQQQLAAGNLEAARKLFIEAKRPGKAAQVAVREGRFDLAGELFEKEGRLDKAIVAYRRAGNAQKFHETQAKITAKAQRAKDEAAAKAGRDSSPQPEPVPSVAPAKIPLSEAMRKMGPPPSLPTKEAAPEEHSDEWANLPSDGSDALLFDDGLLDLPSVEVAPPPAPAATPSVAQRAALGVLSLIKSRKARGIVEDTAAVDRSRNDER